MPPDAIDSLSASINALIQRHRRLEMLASMLAGLTIGHTIGEILTRLFP
jgi:hypothetical protein